MAMTDKFNASLTALMDCASYCDLCAAACLREKDIHNLINCIRSDLDCAEMCRVTAAMLARSSDCISTVCAACAEICAFCAHHCEMHDYEHCRECAKACRRAQEECEAIAA
jgi:hypothetical protein